MMKVDPLFQSELTEWLKGYSVKNIQCDLVCLINGLDNDTARQKVSSIHRQSIPAIVELQLT